LTTVLKQFQEEKKKKRGKCREKELWKGENLSSLPSPVHGEELKEKKGIPRPGKSIVGGGGGEGELHSFNNLPCTAQKKRKGGKFHMG